MAHLDLVKMLGAKNCSNIQVSAHLRPHIAATPKLSRRVEKTPSVNLHAAGPRLVASKRLARNISKVQASAQVAAATAPAPAQKEFKWGANMKNLGICLAIGVATWFAPAPNGELLTESCPVTSQGRERFVDLEQFLTEASASDLELKKLCQHPSDPSSFPPTIVYLSNHSGLHLIRYCPPYLNPSPILYMAGVPHTHLMIHRQYTMLCQTDSDSKHYTCLVLTVPFHCRGDHSSMASAGNFPCHNCRDHHAAIAPGCCRCLGSRSDYAHQGAHLWCSLQRLCKRDPVSFLNSLSMSKFPTLA